MQQNHPAASFELHPMADGGDGSLAILREALDLRRVSVTVEDPLGRSIATEYLNNETTAYIEVASASGLVLLDPSERNPALTSSYGTGQMILDATKQGKRKVYLFLGGSTTNDLGFGIAAALGFKFSSAGQIIERPAGGDLGAIDRIQGPETELDLELVMLCDVKNPLFGPNGAAHVYARQKGADAAGIEQLDAGLQSSSKVLKEQWGKDVSRLQGGGAAGGIAAGLYALLGARIQPGFATINELTGLEAKVAAADLVISGEGMLDGQSLEGKVVDGVAQLCRKYQKPLHLFVGDSSLDEKAISAQGIASVQTIRSKATDLADAMVKGAEYLTDLAAEVDW